MLCQRATLVSSFIGVGWISKRFLWAKADVLPAKNKIATSIKPGRFFDPLMSIAEKLTAIRTVRKQVKLLRRVLIVILILIVPSFD